MCSRHPTLERARRLTSSPVTLPVGSRPGTHWIGGWVEPRAGLDVVDKPLAPTSNRTLDGPASNLVTILSYTCYYWCLHILFPCPSTVTYPTKGTLKISGQGCRKRLPEVDTADAHNPPHTANFLCNFMSCDGLHGRQHDKWQPSVRWNISLIN